MSWPGFDAREVLGVLAAAVLAGAVAALILARWLRGWRGSRVARQRAARAGAGEGHAAVLLRRAGYRIVAAQARTRWTVRIDGEPLALELRADYLVEAGGERLVAEVKTGDVAPRLTTAATRRQLLEYLVAFEADGVLLVCPEAGAIHRIEFPRVAGATGSARSRRSRAGGRARRPADPRT